MTNKQIKLIYKYMEWDFEKYILGDCSHPLDSNTAWECAQEIIRRKDWEKFIGYIFDDAYPPDNAEEIMLSGSTMFRILETVMNPTNFFNFMSKWLKY